jgi:Zn-dependent metalloprotease
MNCIPCQPVCSVIPPYIFHKLLESQDRNVRQAALNALLTTAHLLGMRSVRATLGFAVAGNADGHRSIFDCQTSTNLSSAVVVRTEEGEPSADDSVNRAFEGLGTTREFYKTVFERNSLDGQGGRLDAYVHYGVKYNNALWDGAEMLFGDGDGQEFTDFTKSLDVIGHELTHGVTQNTAGLVS